MVFDLHKKQSVSGLFADNIFFIIITSDGPIDHGVYHVRGPIVHANDVHDDHASDDHASDGHGPKRDQPVHLQQRHEHYNEQVNFQMPEL